jgi:hypothetical protein
MTAPRPADELRKAIEALCWSAGSYPDEDNDGWPIQSSLENGLLKDEVDAIMHLVSAVERAARIDELRKQIETLDNTLDLIPADHEYGSGKKHQQVMVMQGLSDRIAELQQDVKENKQ